MYIVMKTRMMARRKTSYQPNYVVSRSGSKALVKMNNGENKALPKAQKKVIISGSTAPESFLIAIIATADVTAPKSVIILPRN